MDLISFDLCTKLWDHHIEERVSRRQLGWPAYISIKDQSRLDQLASLKRKEHLLIKKIE